MISRKDAGVAVDELIPGIFSIRPARWPDNVMLLSTTRRGGSSVAPFDSLNLALHVNDVAAAVLDNRSRLLTVLPEGTHIAWLNQVHGVAVVHARDVRHQVTEADACWTDAPCHACSIMTADCLPIMLTDQHGSVVAAVHAGWRGLASGVIENTVATLPVPPASLMAWLGPAIGPQVFEVGAEVRDAFIRDCAEAAGCFIPSPLHTHRFLADLQALARLRLGRLGVGSIASDDDCTFTEQAHYFSYRRDGTTGRMASLILRLPADDAQTS